MLPGYPAVPVTAFISSTLLLLVLITSAERRSWNFGLTVLCVCVFVENFFGAVETIIWKDNADIKLYVFCDLISHWQMLTTTVKPACTLVITRRLHKIACMQSLVQTTKEKRFEVWFNVTLLFFLPVLVAGPLYYIMQPVRFAVIEGYGCTNNIDQSFLAFILIDIWRILFPLYSIVVYCPRIFWEFYKHNRSVNRFLNTNGEVSRSRFFRVLAIGSLDILFTLPQGAIATVAIIFDSLQDNGQTSGTINWYTGWDFLHRKWDPVSISLEAFQEDVLPPLTANYGSWTSILLAFAIFALFGLTKATRASYWRIVCVIARLFGCDLASRVKPRDTLLPMTFGRRTRRTQASGNGTQFTVFVDVASAVRRDARDDFENGNTPYASDRNDAWSIPPSYRSSFDSGKTPAPSYHDHEGVTRPFGSLAPSYRTDPIELPSPAHLTHSHH